MKTEKDDRKVEKSYLIENWLTLNKTPFSQWKTETQHKNLLLMCLEIFEEMETQPSVRFSMYWYARYIRYRSFSQEKTKHCPSQQQAVQEKRKERQTMKGWEQAGGWRFSICNLWDMT